MRLIKLIILTAILSLTTNLLFAQAGVPDPEFGTAGSVILYYQGYYTAALDVAVDESSNIYVSGIADTGYTREQDFVVAKLFPDGEVDSSFGTDGTAYIDFGEPDEFGTSIAIQDDGKIVVAGTQSIQFHGLIAVTRLNTDGTIDESFGTDGKVLFNPETWSYYGWIQDMMIQPDGKILMTGFSYDGANRKFLVVRLNSDGSFDKTFGDFQQIYNEDGTIICNQFYSNEEMGNKLLLTSDSKIILIGRSDGKLAVVKLNSNGSIDSTFGENGSLQGEMSVLQTGGKIGEDGFSGALQSDEKIVVIGGSDDFEVARFNVDGSIDESFGENGFQTIDYSGDHDWGRDIVVESNDNIILGGDFYTGANTGYHMGVARLLPDGNLDNSFNGNGKSYSLQGQSGYSLALSPDSAVVIVGTSRNNRGFNIAKFLTHSNTTEVESTEELSKDFKLYQNYPNPFNPTTSIKFSIAKAGENVTLKVYDILGSEIATLVDKQLSPGVYEVNFNAEDLASGLYLYTIKAGNVYQSKKMLLLK